MISEAFLKRVLMFVGVILSGLITLIFISTPESLQVPVPDSLPNITTKSALSQEFLEAKKYFESSIQEKIPNASINSIVSWSPNSKYILANLDFTEKNNEGKTVIRTRPYVFDMTARSYIPIPNASQINQVSWSENLLAYPAETGFAYFDLENKTGKVFGSLVGGKKPIFSGDGAYIAYQENGMTIYSLKAEKSIKLTNENADMPVLWKSDNKTIIFSRIIEKNRTLSEMKIGTDEIKLLAELPEPPRSAEWINKDNLALVTLGFDDGFFDYTFDFGNNSLKLLAETSENIAFVSVGNREFATLKGNKISLYGSDGEKVSEAQRSEKNKIANFFLLPSSSVLLVREKSLGYDTSLFNLKNGNEFKLQDVWQRELILAPNGKSAVVIKKGSDMAEFIDLPPSS